jgi:hypothetical protein
MGCTVINVNNVSRLDGKTHLVSPTCMVHLVGEQVFERNIIVSMLLVNKHVSPVNGNLVAEPFVINKPVLKLDLSNRMVVRIMRR